MPLSSGDITAVLQELIPAVTGGVIQKISQPAPEVIVLEVRRPGHTRALLISADAETARLHLVWEKYASPPTPPSFCQLLRARIEGARIDGIEQLPGERIVRMHLVARDKSMTLVAELTGRHADLLLLDEAETLVATLRNRPGQTGQVYRAPTLCPTTRPQRTAPIPIASETDPFPLSAALETEYRTRELERERERARTQRATYLRKVIKKAVRRIESLEADLEKASRYRDYARYGELLKGRLRDITRGQERVTVVDYFDPALPEIVLPLDPTKDSKGNMEDYFRKHRKLITAEREIRPRVNTATRELDTMKSELTAVERDDWQPPALSSGSASPSPGTSRSARQHSPGPFRRFVSADGLPIFVGRNAAENEELTFGLARSHDLWFHASGTPGSHVVMRIEKGIDAPSESIRDAATLALQYSDLKKSGKGEVIYAKRNTVRKVKGRPAGTVTVTQEKSIFVELNRNRLQRLKGSGERASPL